MSINTKLSRGDRIGTVIGGVGLIAYPFVRGVDSLAAQLLLVGGGLTLLLVGGLGGT